VFHCATKTKKITVSGWGFDPDPTRADSDKLATVLLQGSYREIGVMDFVLNADDITL